MDKDGNGDKPVSWSVVDCSKTAEKYTMRYLYDVSMYRKNPGII